MSTSDQFRHVVFFSQLKPRVDNILIKTEALRIHLNIDGVPVVLRSHYERRVDPSVLTFSLSSQQQSYKSLLLNSGFIV